MNCLFELLLLALVLIGCFPIVRIVLGVWDLIELRKHKGEPYYKLDFLSRLISVEGNLLLLSIAIFGACLIIIYKGEWKMPELSQILIDVLVGVVSSIVVSVITTIFIYYKYLKHIPNETRKQMDELLNDRLNHETGNHNAVLQKSDSTRESLSREHSELGRAISDVNLGVHSMSENIKHEKEMKELQYDYLQHNDKILIDSVNRLSLFSEAFERVNLENRRLQEENAALKHKNDELKSELLRYSGTEQETAAKCHKPKQ